MRKPLVGLLGAVLLMLPAPAAHASYPGLNGKIAFHDMPGANNDEDIFVMEPNGSGQTAITGPPLNERGPVWSPDGTRIAFDLNSDVHVMNADGSGVINLTPGTFSADTSPTWSPDGGQ